MTQITEPSNSYWNYRVVKTGELVGIHEVHYDSEGYIQFISAEAVNLIGDSIEDLRGDLHHMEANLVLPIIDSRTLKEME